MQIPTLMKVRVTCRAPDQDKRAPRASRSHDHSMETPISASSRRLRVHTEMTAESGVLSERRTEPPALSWNPIQQHVVSFLALLQQSQLSQMITLFISLLTFHLFCACQFSSGSITVLVGCVCHESTFCIVLKIMAAKPP